MKSKEPQPIHGAALWLAERVRELEELARTQGEKMADMAEKLGKASEKTK